MTGFSTSKSPPAPSSISIARMENYKLALKEALPIESLKIDDESYLHAGHAGAQGGAGHYRIFIKSTAFNGLPRVQQHRLVYDALSAWMPHEIHALAIVIQ